jgi:hypothetical protein
MNDKERARSHREPLCKVTERSHVTDAHHDGRIRPAYLRRLYLRENTLISAGIKYECSELALIHMEWV